MVMIVNGKGFSSLKDNFYVESIGAHNQIISNIGEVYFNEEGNLYRIEKNNEEGIGYKKRVFLENCDLIKIKKWSGIDLKCHPRIQRETIESMA